MKNKKLTLRFPQVSVIGNAKLENTREKELCLTLGRGLSSAGYSVVCGGLGGVMTFVCKGFKEIQTHENQTIGILPSYDHDSANPYIDIVIATGLDVGRNQIVVASGFAVIAIGGGAGTLSEIAIASQINKPVILLKGAGGWADRLHDDFLDERKNARIFHANTVEDVFKHLSDIALNAQKDIGPINSGHNR